MAESDRYWKYFDEAWKQVIERFFPDLLRFFVPQFCADVDFSRGVEFLNIEMEQLSPKSRGGAKFADKLAKVYLKDGTEQWILVHIEVQGDAEEEFSLRMFRYFYRIYDKTWQTGCQHCADDRSRLGNRGWTISAPGVRKRSGFPVPAVSSDG